MKPHRTIRIADVRPDGDGWHVSYYQHGDELCAAAWPYPRPDVGALYEWDDGDPQLLMAPVHGAPQPQDDAWRWRVPNPAYGGQSRYQILRRRHKIARAVRDYLDGQDFIEIMSPLLVRGTTPELAAPTFAFGDGHYLVPSTEYQLKRLVVGGIEKLYSLTQNFRTGDRGTYRNPEFTMLEWGRVGDTMRRIEQDAEALVLGAMTACGMDPVMIYQGRPIDMRAPWDRMTVAEAVAKVTGVSFDAFDAPTCARAVRAAGVQVRADWEGDRDFLFSLLMDTIQPQLGLDRPVFVTDWPMFQTVSAGAKGADTVDRTEIYVAGIELADGFAGLADPKAQRDAFVHALAERRRLGMPAVETDERYAQSLKQGMPRCAGMALGFDRLVMLLCDQKEILPTLAFGWDEL